ncbi:MAG: site-specific integrase [Oscillospiraceae bacterium]|nr:site-specific integrase [Oscillospiraceae bacterium]
MAIFKAKQATKDGRKWYFSVCYQTAYGERGRKKSGLYATKQEAQEAERQFLREKTYDRVDITFEEMYHQYLEYADEYIKGSTKYCKQNRVKNHILTYFGKMNIHTITVTTVIEWKSKINKCTYNDDRKYMVSYKQTLFKELRTALKYGVDFCGLKENVAGKVMNFRDRNERVIADEDKIRYITPTEYNLFASVIGDLLFKVFFAFLYYMGVRKGEAQALNWEDIDFEKSQVRIIKTITNKTDELNEHGIRLKITNTKNRKNRTIKIPPILKNMLLELYQYYLDYEGFNDDWFVFGGNRHLPSTIIDSKKEFYFKLVEQTYGKAINRITNHEFRHSHASYLISKGVKAELIAYRLGDTVGVVLEIYAHLFPEAQDEVIETLDLIETDYNIVQGIKKEFLKSLLA